MQLQITARHFQASDEVQEYVSDRMGKLERFYDGILNAHVILDLVPVQNNSTHECQAEISLHVYRQVLTAKYMASTHEEAVNQCISNLKRQVSRYKEKLRHKHKYKNKPKAETEADLEPPI